MYEGRGDAPLPPARFLRRMARHAGVAALFVGGSLALGMVGYRFFEELDWLDAFLNASMLLGGMGPVNNPQTSGGKLFAGLYALYSGLVFLVTAGVLGAPVLHRALHIFHWRKDAVK